MTNRRTQSIRVKSESLFHRHFHHHLLHRAGHPAGRQPRLVRILREDQEEVPVADDRINARAVGIPCRVARLVVRDGFGDLRQRFAAHQFRADDCELDVDEPPMGFITQLVRRTRHILAHHGLDAQVQQMRADFNLWPDARHVIQCQVDRRRQALVRADVLDVVVNHLVKGICRLVVT